MQISVVIPALNEASNIARAIKSAWEAGFDEVVVADGCSNDDTPKIASSCGARVISSKKGRAVQQNLGAQHTSGEVLLFLHADNWLAPTAGHQIRQSLSDSDCLGGAFEQCILAEGWMYRCLEWGNTARVKCSGLAYGDQAIFMRRATFDQLGGFPPVELMEDLLLMRAFRNLARPRLLPGPVYVHPRRWQQHGVMKQTLLNWSLLLGEKIGVSPNQLTKYYPVHDRLGI